MSQLLGRDNERRALDRSLGAARQGLSSAVVVRGEPGIGKTKLLDYAIDSATGFCIARTAGVEAETELGYAALHALCGRMLDRASQLPRPQADALLTAFGLRSGEPPNRFLIGLGVLSLLSGVAAERPVLWVVDDAQWLDEASSQLLGFVARRLEAESVVTMFGTRDVAGDALAGLPELSLPPLSNADSRALLASGISGRLDAEVEDRIIAEAQGNPLALLELPSASTPAEVAGGFAVPRGGSISARVEHSFQRRIDGLPADTQTLLLLAAAEPLGDPDLLWAAADRLGLDPTAAAPAAARGLLSIRTHVAFRHPMVRSAVYSRAEPDQQRRVHGALAAATDPVSDPDRRAWHRAEASAERSEDVAAELERSAKRAHARGGLAAEAAFMQRAAALTPERDRRAARALDAAEAKLMVGAVDSALELLALARQGALDPLARARLKLAHANARCIAGAGDAPDLLLQAAEVLARWAPDRSRETYLHAIVAAAHAGPFSQPAIGEVAERAALAAPPAGEPPRAVDLLLNGYATRYTAGDSVAAPLLAAALMTFRDDTAPPDDVNVELAAIRTAATLRDDEAWLVLATRLVHASRNTGALTVLPSALEMLAGLEVCRGHFDAAARLIHEADAITSAIGGLPAHYAEVLLAGWRGRERDTTAVAETMLNDKTAGGEGWAILASNIALAVLHNGAGRYDLALKAALSAFEVDETFFCLWAGPEVIEAATRSGDPGVADNALRRLTAGAGETDWALGVQARARALITEDARGAEDLYLEAIARLDRTMIATDLARAHLVYGEWLRRERRRNDARTHLRTAYEMFASMSADAFAERTARELRATGDQRLARAATTESQLTAHQVQIALLARNGRSNHEIAEELFISPRTVEYHLHNIFIKLDIVSRNQLDSALDDEAQALRSRPRTMVS